MQKPNFCANEMRNENRINILADNTGGRGANSAEFFIQFRWQFINGLDTTLTTDLCILSSRLRLDLSIIIFAPFSSFLFYSTSFWLFIWVFGSV